MNVRLRSSGVSSQRADLLEAAQTEKVGRRAKGGACTVSISEFPAIVRDALEPYMHKVRKKDAVVFVRTPDVGGGIAMVSIERFELLNALVRIMEDKERRELVFGPFDAAVEDALPLEVLYQSTDRKLPVG